jgi:hypothetical protein
MVEGRVLSRYADRVAEPILTGDVQWQAAVEVIVVRGELDLTSTAVVMIRAGSATVAMVVNALRVTPRVCRQGRRLCWSAGSRWSLTAGSRR